MPKQSLFLSFLLFSLTFLQICSSTSGLFQRTASTPTEYALPKRADIPVAPRTHRPPIPHVIHPNQGYTLGFLDNVLKGLNEARTSLPRDTPPILLKVQALIPNIEGPRSVDDDLSDENNLSIHLLCLRRMSVEEQESDAPSALPSAIAATQSRYKVTEVSTEPVMVDGQSQQQGEWRLKDGTGDVDRGFYDLIDWEVMYDLHIGVADALQLIKEFDGGRDLGWGSSQVYLCKSKERHWKYTSFRKRQIIYVFETFDMARVVGAETGEVFGEVYQN